MPSKRRDQLFAESLGAVEKFIFDDRVAEVFPDMISRSVPGYQSIIQHCGDLAERFVRADSNCYDLGCSLGATSLAIAKTVTASNTKIIAIDNAPAMLSRCRAAIEHFKPALPITLIEGDICDAAIENASMVVLNFTLQFVDPNKRSALLANIYRGLNHGGCLVISEKIRIQPAPLDALMVDLHHQFKRAQGYSDLEISQKREAIEDVLIPETREQHIDRLQSVGFESATIWFQCYNFCSLVAIKG